MKSFFSLMLILVVLGIAGPGTARADEALRRVQQSLRDQGFYYGPVDGSAGDETTQAVRRYQIRNGLPVTGQLDDQTRKTILQTGSASSQSPATINGDTGNQRGQSSANGGTTTRGTTVRPAPTPSTTQPTRRAAPPEEDDDSATGPAYQRPTVRPVPDEGNQDDGRSSRGNRDDDAPMARGPGNPRPDLRAGPDAPEDRPLPRNAVLPSARLSAVFASTPYEFAPPPVQADVLRRAQKLLTREGFYDGPVNGVPSELTADSLANFQGVNRLRKTGRLDVSTLGMLRLLPGRQAMGPRERVDEGDPNVIYQGRIAR